MAEDRIAALRQRVRHAEGEPTEKERKQAGASDRDRHTIYLSKTLMRVIDRSFKEARVKLHPHDIEKADYLEACFKVALAHQDEVDTILSK